MVRRARAKAKPIELTASQIAFLKFHADEPFPHKWEWLEAGPPENWRRLRAYKLNGASQVTIERGELHALIAARLISTFKVTPAGMRAIKRAGKA